MANYTKARNKLKKRQTDARRDSVLKLIIAGTSAADIPAILEKEGYGITTQSAVYRDLKLALEKNAPKDEKAIELKRLTYDKRYETLWATWYPKAMGSPAHEKPDPDNPDKMIQVEAVPPSAEATAICMRVQDSLRALWGTDTPIKIDITAEWSLMQVNQRWHEENPVAIEGPVIDGDFKIVTPDELDDWEPEEHTNGLNE